MPQRPRAACSHQPCPHFLPCPLHRTWSQPGTRGYSSAAWRRIRSRVVAEEPLCPGIGARCGRPTTDADHIVPRRAGGGDGRSNLRALCHGCHSRRTLSDRNAARR